MLLKNQGFFEKEVAEYTEELEARLDNLLGSVKQGSTTMDAEVIDLRVDKNGGVHASAGLAVRRMLTHEAYTADGKIDSSIKNVVKEFNQKYPIT